MTTPASASTSVSSSVATDDAPAPAPAATKVEPPPHPGVACMPPRIPEAQRVIDAMGDAGRFQTAIIDFLVASPLQLSPIQCMWQHGEFIRLALDADRPVHAIAVASLIFSLLFHPTCAATIAGVDERLFTRPGSLLVRPLGRASVWQLEGVNRLLFLAYYMPLCPELGASHDLFKRVVQVAARDASGLHPIWISAVLQAGCGQFYIDATDPYLTWFHAMRHDHTLAAAKWLLGGEAAPLPITILMSHAAGNLNTVRDLLDLPPEIRELMLDAILRTQERDVLERVRFHAHGVRLSATDMVKIQQRLASMPARGSTWPDPEPEFGFEAELDAAMASVSDALTRARIGERASFVP